MFSKAIQKVSKSIFPIFHYGPQSSGVLGTGFFIDERGYFMTAAHVLNALPPGSRLGYLGNIPNKSFTNQVMIDISTIANDVDKDLAIGRVDSEILDPLFFAEEDAVIGQSISLCGYPLPMIQSQKQVHPVSKAVNMRMDVSRVRQYWQPTIKMDKLKPNFILNKKFSSFLTQHAALPGMSGGPIFNIDAEVVGVTSAVWPRKVPLDSKRHISIENGVGVDLEEVKRFAEEHLGLGSLMA